MWTITAERLDKCIKTDMYTLPLGHSECRCEMTRGELLITVCRLSQRCPDCHNVCRHCPRYRHNWQRHVILLMSFNWLRYKEKLVNLEETGIWNSAILRYLRKKYPIALQQVITYKQRYCFKPYILQFIKLLFSSLTSSSNLTASNVN